MRIEIGKDDKYMSAWQFVIAARSKDTTRFACQSILVQENRIVATDGKRLHVAYYDNPLDSTYTPGLYEVVKANKSTILLLKKEKDDTFFPSRWQEVIPHYQTFYPVRTGYAYPSRFVELILGLLGKHSISLVCEYLKPLSAIDGVWQVFFGDSEQPVRFVSEYNKHMKYRLEAVIMPINLQLDAIRLTTKAERRHNVA